MEKKYLQQYILVKNKENIIKYLSRKEFSMVSYNIEKVFVEEAR